MGQKETLEFQKRGREMHRQKMELERAESEELVKCSDVYTFTPLDTDSALYRFAFWIIAAYLAAGSVFYAYAEEWEWYDSFYFCTVTLLTVGYGDLAPTTDTSKAFTVIYILLGL